MNREIDWKRGWINLLQVDKNFKIDKNKNKNFRIVENFQVFLDKEKHVIDQWTNRRTNQQTDPQTDPFIEMQKLSI